MSLDEMRKEVFARKKNFGNIVEAWGDRTWIEYYTQDFKNLREPSEALLGAIEKETSAALGSQVALCAKNAVRSTKWVSTSDHHGLLCHPYFYSGNMARSDVRVRGTKEATVTLSFGNISLSNDSFPRGFFFHTADFVSQRFLFKSLRDRSMPVYALRPMTKDFFMKECDRVRSVPLKNEARTRLESFLEELVRASQVWSQETYSAQLTAMNQVLWKALFGNDHGELVYLEIDSVVRRLLLEKHLHEHTAIHLLLFEQEWREAFIELFTGVQGSHTETTGTHFFWYIDGERKIRRSLRVRNAALCTSEGDVSIELSPEAIREKVLQRILVPSTALILLMVHAEERLTCAGGLSQLDYLGNILEQWGVLLEHFGLSQEKTNTTIASVEWLLFAARSGDQCTEASLMDVLLYKPEETSFPTDSLGNTKIIDTIDAMIPTLYWLLTRTHVPSRYAPSIPSLLF